MFRKVKSVTAIAIFSLITIACNSQSNYSTELTELCDLYNQAEDFMRDDIERAEIALSLDSKARILAQKDQKFNELKDATFEYYKVFKLVADAKISGQTGVIGSVSPEYVSATSFLKSFCQSQIDN